MAWLLNHNLWKVNCKILKSVLEASTGESFRCHFWMINETIVLTTGTCNRPLVVWNSDPEIIIREAIQNNNSFLIYWYRYWCNSFNRFKLGKQSKNSILSTYLCDTPENLRSFFQYMSRADCFSQYLKPFHCSLETKVFCQLFRRLILFCSAFGTWPNCCSSCSRYCQTFLTIVMPTICNSYRGREKIQT